MPETLRKLGRRRHLTSALIRAASVATVLSGVLATSPATASVPKLSEIRNDLTQRNPGTSFQTLIQHWEAAYGADAVPSLIRLAADSKMEDTHRYIALMGAAKLGGSRAAPVIQTFLKDSSWMMRNAALRALSSLSYREAGLQAMSLLKDPALVVRSEAIDALVKLRPEGVEGALVDTIYAPSNYRAGKADFVPRRALLALETLEAHSMIPRLLPLLKRKQDPEFRKLAEKTIEKLRSLN
ncbi:MAG: HEAT repeat domain-containing protein [Methylotenera sp.]|nr:HEAT repeat domain-containing protein [Oligoflexia bacterium]